MELDDEIKRIQEAVSKLTAREYTEEIAVQYSRLVR